MNPLVAIDADVLGRQRTGDETYVAGLLRHLPAVAPDLRFAAVTRRPELVPLGVEPVPLDARLQELRVAVGLPRLLRRLRPALAHFQYVIPPGCPCPAVVTIHDLSFERGLMGAKDRAFFRTLVPRSARRAAQVLTVSERTRRELAERYGVEAVVTPNGVDEAFGPLAASGEPPGSPEPPPLVRFADRRHPQGGYLLFVGAIQERKDPLAAADAARAVGLPLVVAGPRKDEALARELERRGADLRGYVERDELAALYRGAAALVLPSRHEGFGLPVLEAMASGTPVVAAPDPALQEVAGDAALFAEPAGLAEAVRRAVAERDRLAAAGLERVRLFSWEETARQTAQAYREAL